MGIELSVFFWNGKMLWVVFFSPRIGVLARIQEILAVAVVEVQG